MYVREMRGADEKIEHCKARGWDKVATAVASGGEWQEGGNGLWEGKGVVRAFGVTWAETKPPGRESESRWRGRRELGEPLFGIWDLKKWNRSHQASGPATLHEATQLAKLQGGDLRQGQPPFHVGALSPAHIHKAISLGITEGCLLPVK